MNICLCVKQVPDTNLIKIDPVTHTLVRKGVPSIVNPFDTYAEELGARMIEQTGGRMIVITMGPPQAAKALTSCMEVGADGAYLITDRAFGGSDTLATSYILATAIREVEKRESLKFDLILCGKQAADGDTAQVGPEIAEHLNCAQITYAVNARAEADRIIVKRETDGGYEWVETRLPAVVTVARTEFEPRYATISTRRRARSAVIPTLTRAELPEIDPARCGLSGSPTKVKNTYTPETAKQSVVFHGADGARALAELLKEKRIL